MIGSMTNYQKYIFLLFALLFFPKLYLFSENHIPINDNIIKLFVKDLVDATPTSRPAFKYTPKSTF